MDIAAISNRVNTTLSPADFSGLRRTKDANTSLASVAPQKNTQITADSARTISTKPDQHDQLVKQTQTWVAQTFFGTMLKQMRESPFKSEIFSGGRGGEAFSSMFDQQLAERMASGSGAKLVNSIVHRIESRANAVRAQAEQKTAPRKSDTSEMTSSSPFSPGVLAGHSSRIAGRKAA